MKMLYSALPVNLQNVEILSYDEKALWRKWEHTVFLSTFWSPTRLFNQHLTDWLQSLEYQEETWMEEEEEEQRI